MSDGFDPRNGVLLTLARIVRSVLQDPVTSVDGANDHEHNHYVVAPPLAVSMRAALDRDLEAWLAQQGLGLRSLQPFTPSEEVVEASVQLWPNGAWRITREDGTWSGKGAARLAEALNAMQPRAA